MPKAAATPTTPATLARRRHTRAAPGALDRREADAAPAPSGPPPGYTARRGTVRPTDAHFFGGVLLLDAYGCPLKGDCLSPEINEGDMPLVSPSAEPKEGDFVVLYFVSGAVPLMKRLVMAPMVPIGTKLHPDSDVMPIVVVEMLNPPRQLITTIDKLTAMHKVVGLIRKDDVAALRNPAAHVFVASKPPRRQRDCPKSGQSLGRKAGAA